MNLKNLLKTSSMELRTETEQEKKGSVTHLLNKINHAVKSSHHFRFSLSSLVSSSKVPSYGNSDNSVSDHQEKMISVSSSNRVDGGDSLQVYRSTKTIRSSSTTLTMAPYHDGYLWRKYGEKKILNSRFPRSYYRCTYHVELNCNATKQVQQCTDDDSPMYQVTCFYEHTCNNISLRNTNGKNNHAQILDFTVKDTSQEQQLASCYDGPLIDVSSINSHQTTHERPVELESIDTYLSWYEPYDLE